MARTAIDRVKFSVTLLVFLALLTPSLASAAEPKDHNGWNYRKNTIR